MKTTSDEIAGAFLIILVICAFGFGSCIADWVQTKEVTATIQDYKYWDGGNGAQWWLTTTSGDMYALPLFDSKFQDLYHKGDTIVFTECRNHIQDVKSRL